MIRLLRALPRVRIASCCSLVLVTHQQSADRSPGQSCTWFCPVCDGASVVAHECPSCFAPFSDGDGDLDVVVIGRPNNRYDWYESVGHAGYPSAWIPHTTSGASNARAVYAVDANGACSHPPSRASTHLCAPPPTPPNAPF